jgi:hypothetical protein
LGDLFGTHPGRMGEPRNYGYIKENNKRPSRRTINLVEIEIFPIINLFNIQEGLLKP